MFDKKIVEDALAGLNKTLEQGVVTMVNESEKLDIERISTGSLTIDKALGGGFAKGRIHELIGQESSGKTTLALMTIAQAQKSGKMCAIVDYEFAFDKHYAEALGVDTSALVISQPTTAEQGLEVVDALIRTEQFEVILIDSVAAMSTASEVGADYDKTNIGKHAALMSRAMRKLVGITAKHNCTLIFINQYREKIGVMFGDPRTTTGGNALKFYASSRTEMTRGTKAKNKEEIIGNIGSFKVLKNKTYRPYEEGSFHMTHGFGISKIDEIIDLGVEYGLIKQSGSWFAYGDTKIGQGREKVKGMLEDNPELMEELETKIREQI